MKKLTYLIAALLMALPAYGQGILNRTNLAAPATGDGLLVEDASPSSTKYITLGELWTWYQTQAVDFSVATGLAISGGDLVFTERADHSSTPSAGFGYLWTKNTIPSTLIFTDDEGTDFTLGSGAADNLGNHTATQIIDASTFGIQFSAANQDIIGSASGIVYDTPTGDDHDFHVNGLSQLVIGVTNVDFQSNNLIDVFNITASNTITGTTLTAGSTTADGTVIIHDDDVGGDATITLQAPDALGTAYTLTLPPNDGAAGQQLQTDGAGVLTWEAAGSGVRTEFVPVGWMEDGATPPAALETFNDTRKTGIRKFAGATANEDCEFFWQLPADATDAVAGGDWQLKYRVIYIVTEATGPTAEGVSFDLQGVAIADNEDIGAASLGTVAESDDATTTAVQNDLLYSDYVEITLTGAAAGEGVFFKFQRDQADAVDTYAQDIGVVGIEFKFTYETATY